MDDHGRSKTRIALSAIALDSLMMVPFTGAISAGQELSAEQIKNDLGPGLIATICTLTILIEIIFSIVGGQLTNIACAPLG